MKLIGLTGYMGSGKSIVASIFKFLGATVYDSDTVAKTLMQENKSLVDKIKTNFGSDIYDDNGNIIRDKLRELIFNDEDKRMLLNSMVHPCVYQDFKNFVETNNDKHLILFESALLLKGDFYKNFDTIIFVTADLRILISRITKRNGLNTDLIKKILENQKISKNVLNNRNIIKLTNNETTLLIPRIVKIYKRFI
jgi:dephospho-CoA kinase